MDHDMNYSASDIKQLILDELQSLGFLLDHNGKLVPPRFNKETLIFLHKTSRDIVLEKGQAWIIKKIPKYVHFFANGCDIVPPKIKPILIRVTENWHKDLFRLSHYYWSLPCSNGFGRRLRYLILDEYNGKIIGIFGLQSPPISFPARDKKFSIPQDKKPELVNQTMDIFVLGSLPPYNRLLGGKLVALAAASNEVRADYKKIYTGRVTEMDGRIIPAHLVALTTTSAYGRSSIYNRLKYKNFLVAESLGETNGYGNFHLQKLYPIIKQYLASQDISINGGYGTGPRRTWQLLSRALDLVGLDRDLLKHGIRREAFIFPLIYNLRDYLEGRTSAPDFRDMPFSDLSEFWKERWLMERYKRVDGWHMWDNQGILESIVLTEKLGEL